MSAAKPQFLILFGNPNVYEDQRFRPEIWIRTDEIRYKQMFSTKKKKKTRCKQTEKIDQRGEIPRRRFAKMKGSVLKDLCVERSLAAAERLSFYNWVRMAWVSGKWGSTKSEQFGVVCDLQDNISSFLSGGKLAVSLLFTSLATFSSL